MTENKRFTIDVETENYENAYFEDDKFLCYEDDYDAILNRLNELAEENKQLQNEIARLQLINNKLKDKDYTNYKEKIQELQEKNKELKYHLNRTEKELQEYKDFMSLG